jgi:hypothetical protein
LLGFAAAASAQSTHVVDTSAPGTAFSPGVRGQALADLTIDRPGYTVALPKSLEVSDGAALRGVAGGLAAELYDWRSRNNAPRPPTLEFLRYSRDHNAELFLTVNMRGLVRPENDPSTAGYQEYYDTSIPTLAALAGDWVRYTNHISHRPHLSPGRCRLRDARRGYPQLAQVEFHRGGRLI